MTTFSVRNFLRAKEALLVHFNTPMQSNHPSGYPGDLQYAKLLSGKALSFSTIQVGDKGPWQVPNPANANAGGSIGIVVDVQEFGSVCSVDPEDSGSSDFGSAGVPPGPDTCEASLVQRTTSNEWRVKDYTPLGVFVFLPVRVYVIESGGGFEVDYSFDKVLRDFPNDRIFSIYGDNFVEFDRISMTWPPVAYSQIVP